MTQTVAVVRGLLSAATAGTADFTKSGFGTPSAALIIVCNANTASNPQAGACVSIGFWDGTNQRAVGFSSADAVTTTDTYRFSNDSYGVIFANPGTENDHTVSAITDGIRLTNTVDQTTAQRYCTVLLLAGVSSKVGTLATNTTQNATAASGSLGHAPKLVFCICIGAGTADLASTSTAVLSFGFARDDGTHRMIALQSPDGAADDATSLIYSETRCVGQMSASALAWAGEITTFGADTFTITTRDGTSGADVFFYLSLGGDVSFDVGTLTTRTSTGDDVNATDIAPDAILLTLSTATGTSAETGSGANGFMVGMADVDGQFAHNTSVEDGAGTTNTNSVAQALNVLDLDSSAAGARTDLCDATNTFNVADFTLDYTVVDATARKGWWVAFGNPPVPVQPLIIQYSAAVRRASTY